MSKLIIDEPPLLVLPKLAAKIGLNEAVILQQLHYWLGNSNDNQNGAKWVYNSIADWQKQFPFWSANTIRRTFDSLLEKGIVIKENRNKNAFDKTTWWTINYAKLDEIEAEFEPEKTEKTTANRFTQVGQIGVPKLGSSHLPKLGKPIPENNRDYNTENIPPLPPTEKKSAFADKKTAKAEKLEAQIKASGLPEKAKAGLLYWLEYKKYNYEPIGLKGLLTTAARNVRDYGEEAVCQIIAESAGNLWAGICWEKLEQRTRYRRGQAKPIQERYEDGNDLPKMTPEEIKRKLEALSDIQ